MFRHVQHIRWLALVMSASVLVACGGGDAGTSGYDNVAGSPDNGHRVVTLDHGAFALSYDCVDRITVRYAYTLGVDTGAALRPDTFVRQDPMLPADCPAQTSAASYASVAPGWDRGHLVAANHMDASDALIAQTFLMSNIVPQRAAFNQGIWAEAEAIAECWRDVAPVQVVGGVVANDAANDLFKASHGVVTPDMFWMVLVSADPAHPGQQRALAWWIPNIDATGTLASRQVPIATVERLAGVSRVGLTGLTPSLKTGTGPGWGEPAGGCRLG
ncbi:DNA/RNA non-specific endonuclease [Leptothrix sp. BB-4]